MRAPVTLRQQVVDAVVALVLTVVGVVMLVAPTEDGYRGGPLWLSLVIQLFTTLPLAVRRRWPTASALVAIGAHTLPNPWIAHSLGFWGSAVPIAILLYTAGRHGHPRRSWWALLLAMVCLLTSCIHVPEFRGADDVIFGVVCFGAAWGAGRVIARLTHQREALDAALLELEQQREAHSRQVLLEERTRIAREMHDVVAHGVSVMVVQTGAARMDLEDDVDSARDSLLAVETIGREVLTELRRTVSLLRSPSQHADGTAPSPGLAQLPDLVESMRGSGLTVDLRLESPSGSDPGRELAVYRIVQEALTNALRHGGGTRVEVHVSAEPLAVEVRDHGPVAPTAPGASVGGGHGLIGLRERVAMYGGSFQAGQEATGFVVRAAIPTEPAR
ncbi:histidine kinase [Ornithinimicrobium sp. F0845]|uniref:sensor histidine kinase n=1 Tax=Ornithinimicrobium sp. F0845 TaxID=2926412 RepID=UPI001FF2BE66|nr:histidine kinase [Ornithinimicrobium sp. F0845]MCK0113002.1 histidine kinase [Ornithinimicrobium sp. F0845]